MLLVFLQNISWYFWNSSVSLFGCYQANVWSVADVSIIATGKALRGVDIDNLWNFNLLSFLILIFSFLLLRNWRSAVYFTVCFTARMPFVITCNDSTFYTVDSVQYGFCKACHIWLTVVFSGGLCGNTRHYGISR